ncbi:MAG: AAA family ATPase [Cytophagales bacterium]|nr:AAA family ATPase [Cytophagales bacterium]
MEDLYLNSNKKLKNTAMDFRRYLYHDIDDTERLIGITGARGTGKTTILLQKLKEKNIPAEIGLYASMDDIYFTTHRLVDVADEHVRRGGKYLYLDEVHKYDTWSIELKNIYDNYPELYVIFTGSSILEMSKTQGDLSRRAMVYKLETMSYREYLVYEHKFKFDAVSLPDMVIHHVDIVAELLNKNFLPFIYFDSFLKYGSYPFSAHNKSGFFDKLLNTINMIIENDLIAVTGIDYNTAMKIKKLLVVISESVPFKPSIHELAAKIGVDRRYVYRYLDYLSRTRLINMLVSDEKGLNAMVKPEMIYLENPSIVHVLCGSKPEKGMLRETFFYNQLNAKHHVSYTPAGDFLIDHKYIFEVGGKNKTFRQIKNLPESYLAIDEIESGYGNKMPLWLFGFLR